MFDPDNVYSIAYQWGTTGFAYRSDKVPGTPDSWGIFLDGRYKGRMTQMDEMRACLGVNRDDLGAGLGEGFEIRIGRRDHQMAIEGLLRAPADGTDHGRAEGDVGDEVAIHHVHMHPVAPLGLDRLAFGAEVGEVRREDRRRDLDGPVKRHSRSPLPRSSARR